jgi:hypothetical protein
MADRAQIRQMVKEIEESGVSLYKLAAFIEPYIKRPFQYVQIERIKETGRCEHDVGEAIIDLYVSIVPRKTLQIVPRAPTQMMQYA